MNLRLIEFMNCEKFSLYNMYLNSSSLEWERTAKAFMTYSLRLWKECIHIFMLERSQKLGDQYKATIHQLQTLLGV